MMRRIQCAAAAIAVSAAFAAPVSAADLGPYRPATGPIETYVEPARMFSWRGFYAGLNGGYAWGDSDVTVVSGGGAGALEAIDPSGFLGGGQIGYNAQFGNFVIGAEADLQGGWVDGDTSGNIAGIGPVAASSELNWLSTVRGRVGFAGDRILIYATGGVAWADMDFAVTDGVTTLSGGDTLTGYALGAGVEWALANNWTAKAEYLYVDLDDVSLTGGGTTATFDNAFHTMRVGVNYKF